MEQHYAVAIAEMVRNHIISDMKTIIVTVKCCEGYYLVESSEKYLTATNGGKINLDSNEIQKIDGEVSKDREAVFFEELQECLVKIAFMNPKIAISLYEEDESDNRKLAFITKQCNNLPEKVADIKKIKLNDIFLVSFESHDCEVEFCFFVVSNNNTNPNYVFTAGYLNFTISQRFKIQLIDENIGFIGVISEDKQTIMEWCVPIIIEKLKSHLCEKNAQNYVDDLLGEPRTYRKSTRSKTDSKEAVVDLTRRIMNDRINNIEVLEQFCDEIECSSIESSCCDIPIVYDKEIKTWKNGWDQQCIKVKTVNRDVILNWIESSDFTIPPDFGKNIWMIPENSKLFSHKDIEILNSKKKETESREEQNFHGYRIPKRISTPSAPQQKSPIRPHITPLFLSIDNSAKKYKDLLNRPSLFERKNENEDDIVIETENQEEHNFHGYRIPKRISAPQRRSPIRPHITPPSIDHSAKKFKDFLNRRSLFERKNDNEDDIVFVDEVKKKPSSKAFTKDDLDDFTFKIPVKNESTSYTPRKSINMLPENSNLISLKYIEFLNSKKKETESQNDNEDDSEDDIVIETENQEEHNFHGYRIPKRISAPQRKSPIRPHITPPILSIDNSAKKNKDPLSRPSLFERKNDNEDDIVFVDEVKKKPPSNDENNNGQKKRKLYLPVDDDELILIEDNERPSTSSHNKNRFKLFTTKNNRLHGVPKRNDHYNHNPSPSKQSQYSRHNKR